MPLLIHAIFKEYRAAVTRQRLEGADATDVVETANDDVAQALAWSLDIASINIYQIALHRLCCAC